jgi:hypothetical protein
MLMDFEPGWDEDDEEIQEGGNEEEAKTRKTGKSQIIQNEQGSNC